MQKRQILFKDFTSVEICGENNEISRNIENLITIALWEFFWWIVLNPLILNIGRVCMLPWEQ